MFIRGKDSDMRTYISRRSALTKIAGTTVAAVVAANLSHRLGAADGGPRLNGRINQSVCKWCYGKIPLDEFCEAAKKIGLQSVELLEVKDFPTLNNHGLICAMVSGVPGGITNGLNRTENHDKIMAFMEQTIPIVAEHSYPNIICFSGNRKSMSDEQGLENCAVGLRRIAPIAEKHKVTVCMELLNSKRDHKDYQCDHSKWGVELCKRVGSERCKLLYDIYHMQIMEGDVCATIKENGQYFAHFHTGGVPGRNEIDDTQELNYPRIMRTILDTGFKGFVAQEFIPKRPDALASLEQGVEICDV